MIAVGFVFERAGAATIKLDDGIIAGFFMLPAYSIFR